MNSAYYGPDSMFTSANLAAARLSALENIDCFKRSADTCVSEAKTEESVHGLTLGKAGKGRKTLGSSLVSVAALISKLDEEQPTQWESRSAPTLQLRPIRKTDDALRIFLKRVEKARVNREDSEAETSPVIDVDDYSSQTVTLQVSYDKGANFATYYAKDPTGALAAVAYTAAANDCVYGPGQLFRFFCSNGGTPDIDIQVDGDVALLPKT